MGKDDGAFVKEVEDIPSDVILPPQLKRLAEKKSSVAIGAKSSTFKTEEAYDADPIINQALAEEGNVRNPKQFWFLLRYDNFFRIMFDWMIMAGVVYDLMVIPFDIGYQLDKKVFDTIGLIVDLCFWMDMVLLFFTTYLDNHGNEITSFKPIVIHYLRTWFVIDLIACIPFEYSIAVAPMPKQILSAFSNEDGTLNVIAAQDFIKSCFRINRLLRFFKFIKFINSIEASTSIQFIKLLFYFIVLGHVSAAIFYMIGYVEPLTDDEYVWTSISWIDYFSVRGLPQRDKVITSLYWSFVTVLGVGYGDIFAKSVYEMFWVIIVIIVGAILYTVITSNGMLLIDKMNRASSRRQDIESNILEFMKFQLYPQNEIHKVTRILSKLWIKHRFWSASDVLSSFCPQLQAQVGYEMHGHWLKEIPLFKEAQVDAGFLKALVMHLRPQIALKGDTILNEGEIVYDLCFLKSGRLLLKSADVKGVLSYMKPGDIFGDTGLILASEDYSAAITISAAMDSEYYSIEIEKIRDLLRFYPALERRLSEAAMDKQKSLALKKKKDNALAKVRFLAKLGGFSKFKSQAASDMALMAEEMAEGAHSDPSSPVSTNKSNSLLHSNTINSNNFIKKGGKLVLNKRYGPNGRYGPPATRFRGAVKLIIAGNKMRVPWGSRFMIRPSNPIKQRFDWLVVVCMVFTVIVIPMDIAFRVAETGSPLNNLGWICDFVILANFLASFVTAYYDKHGNLIVDPKLIVPRYMRTSFLVDFFSSFPIDRLANGVGMHLYAPRFETGLALEANYFHTVPLDSFIKLVRLLQLQKVFNKLSTVLRGNTMRLIQSLTQLILFCHWFGCLMYLVGRLQTTTNAVKGDPPWIIYFSLCPDQGHTVAFTECTSTPSFNTRYMVSLYFAVVTVFTIGYGDILPKTQIDRGMIVILVLFNMVMRSVLFGSVANVVSSMDKYSDARREVMDDISMFSLIHYWPSITVKSLHSIVNLFFLRLRGEARDILSILPFNFKSEICEMLYSKSIANSLLFHDLDKHFMKEVYIKVKTTVAVPGQTIFQVGDRDIVLYFVNSGKVILQSADTNIRYATLGPGSSFGEVCVLNGRMTYQATALEASTLHYLETSDIEDLLSNYPKMVPVFRGRAKAFIQSLKEALMPQKSSGHSQNTLQQETSEFLQIYVAQLDGICLNAVMRPLAQRRKFGAKVGVIERIRRASVSVVKDAIAGGPPETYQPQRRRMPNRAAVTNGTAISLATVDESNDDSPQADADKKAMEFPEDDEVVAEEHHPDSTVVTWK